MNGHGFRSSVARSHALALFLSAAALSLALVRPSPYADGRGRYLSSGSAVGYEVRDSLGHATPPLDDRLLERRTAAQAMAPESFAGLFTLARPFSQRRRIAASAQAATALGAQAMRGKRQALATFSF